VTKWNGPPPTPRALRVARGNPGKRPIPRETLKPAAGAEPPPRLNQAAREEWDRLVPELHRLGLLTQLDRAALAAYCDAWALYRRAADRLEEDGDVVTAGNGTLIPHPSVAIAIRAMQKIRELSSEFGFTPAARTRIEMAAAEEDDSDEAFFTGPRPLEPATKRRVREEQR